MMLRKSCVVGITIFRDYGQELAYESEEYANLDECIRKNATKRNLKLINNCSRNMSARRLKKEIEDIVRNGRKMFIIPSENIERFKAIIESVLQEPMGDDYMVMAS